MAFFAPYSSNAELIYWQNMAALLDPDAYQFKNKPEDGAGYSETVPLGETWFVLNAFHAQIDGSAFPFFVRYPNVDNAVGLSAGSTIAFAGTSGFSYIYVCKPSLVRNKAIYSNPKALYFNRLRQIESLLPSFVIETTIAAGSAFGTQSNVAFPADFDKGFVTANSTHDTSWSGLLRTGIGTLNLNNEVSDDHQIRFAQKVYMPFKRSVFDSIRTRGGSVSGAAATVTIQGWAAVSYVKLPTNF